MLILFTCYSLFGTLAWLGWKDAVQTHDHQNKKTLESLHITLNDMVQFAGYGVTDLSNAIQTSDYSTASIYAILRQYVNKGNGIVRFGWSNDQFKLTAGSSTGIYDPAPDVSQRDYIKHATSDPGILKTSAVMGHIKSGRQIFTIYMGITDSNGIYKGTLSGAVNLPPLTHLIIKQMANSKAHYIVTAPKGEVITHRGDIESLKNPNHSSYRFAADNGFTVTGYSDPEEIQQITWRHLLYTAIIILILTSITVLGYLFITRFILRPVESTVTALESILPRTPVPHNLADKLNHIKRLAGHYADMQSQLQVSEQRLTESHRLIEAMSDQQTDILHASSVQMEQTFSAIARYTEHMEEMIIAQRMDEDHQFHFDDVKEMGDNLQLVSSSFYRICAIKEGSNNLQSKPVDLSNSLHHSAHLLSDALDRRNQSLTINTPANAESILHGDASIIAELLYCILYSSTHFAEDEAQIDINLQHSASGWQFTYTLSHYRKSLLSPDSQDFSAFMPSAARDISEPFRALIMQHMNIWIARSFLALHDSDVVVSVDKNGSITLSIEIADLEPLCPTVQDALPVVH